MEKSNLAKIVRNATAGDRDAVEMVLRQFHPLINKRSIINGRIDEDLRQYIIMCVIERLSKFILK